MALVVSEHRRLARPHLDTAAALLATAAVVVWIALGIGGPTVTNTVDNLVELAAATVAGLSCLATAARNRRDRLRWKLLGASCLSWAAGQATWCYYEAQGVAVPFPSAADVGFLIAVPLAVLALREFRPPHPAPAFGDGDRRLDTLCAALGGVLLLGLAVVALSGAANTTAIIESVVSTAYPAGDLVMVAVAATAYRRMDANTTRLGLIVAGIFAFTVSDTAFAYLTAANNYSDATILNVGWIAGYLLIALGARREPPSPEATTAGRAAGVAVDAPSSTAAWATTMRSHDLVLSQRLAGRIVNSAGLTLILVDTAVVLYDLRQLLRLVV